MRILETLSKWLGFGSTKASDQPSGADQTTNNPSKNDPSNDDQGHILKASAKDDRVEYVDAEVVDPTVPPEAHAENGQDGEGNQPPLGLGGQIKAWFARQKLAIYHFFVPPPMLVPAQLKTPEIDLVEMQQPEKLYYDNLKNFFLVSFIHTILKNKPLKYHT